MQERYIRNIGFITKQEQYKLLNQSIAIIGLGGQGGYIADGLARLGIKRLVVFDPDKFEESSLNRQLYCNKDTIGLFKAEQTANELKKVNPDLIVDYYCFAFGIDSIDLVKNRNFIFACCVSTHNPEENREALKICMKHGIPVMDVAVTEFGCQLYCDIDNFEAWDEFSKNYCQTTAEDAHKVGQPAFLCALAANLGVSEMVRYFTYPYPKSIMRAVIIYDLYKNEIFRFPLVEEE